MQATVEQHPLLPSGEWEGFYNYEPKGHQHKMTFTLNFKNQQITGRGSDDVDGFTWSGSYDLQTMRCELVKTYPTHTVAYQGSIDENGIWGNWKIWFCAGGFHIWPTAPAENSAQIEQDIENLLQALEVTQYEVV